MSNVKYFFIYLVCFIIIRFNFSILDTNLRIIIFFGLKIIIRYFAIYELDKTDVLNL